MLRKTVKTIATAYSLIIGLGIASSAEAIAISGTLGSSAAAVDAWRFICPTGTAQARVSVKDNSGVLNTTAIISVSLGENGTPTTIPVSDADNENSRMSGWSTNTTDFDGTYIFVVSKSAAGADDYIAFAECLNSSLTAIGPSTSSILSVVNN